MIPNVDMLATAGREERSCRDLLDRAADEAGNLNAVARRTGISRRRLGYLLAGERALRPGEALALDALIARRL